jgi:hypothetical protein
MQDVSMNPVAVRRITTADRHASRFAYDVEQRPMRDAVAARAPGMTTSDFRALHEKGRP